MQHEMFPHSGLTITPKAGIREPRLWVRKLVIWEKPDKIIREITLRPGLNIIWSPDPGVVEDKPIGHGSGKTTFCRLLRYCLGEDSFAPDGQRNAIWNHFGEGSVGAEIILDGELWVVMRSLGQKKHDVVIKNGSFADAFSYHEPTGIEILRRAISTAIIGNAAQLMPRGIGEDGAWEAALAWASRDQECRFGHHLDWRDSDSNSQSPVRGRSKEDILIVVRALIGALTQQELEERAKESGVERTLSENRSLQIKLDWGIERTRNRLNEALGGGTAVGNELDATSLKTLAQQKLEKVLKLPVNGTSIDLSRLRKDRDAAKDEVSRLSNQIASNAALVEEKEKAILYLQAELPEAYARSISEQNPVCPICRVSIDKTLAEGCGISTVKCDLEALQASIQKKRDEITKIQGEVQAFQAAEPQLKYDLAAAQQKLKPLEERIAAIENAILERSDSVRKAERLLDDAERYSEMMTERNGAVTIISRKEVELEEIKGVLTAHRENYSSVIASLSERFDTIMRELIPSNIKGEIKLDGKGMNLKVMLGGERSTAAIDSLKVVAFDIATLTLTIEGKTYLPSFLLHDSPREADLGGSIYQRLFALMKKMEGVGESPMFQYIVTTTTEPPTDCQSEPWLRLQINGSPASERLMKVDL